MQCKYCGSSNLEVVDTGPHKELICKDCLKHQKFISKKEAARFEKLREKERR